MNRRDFITGALAGAGLVTAGVLIGTRNRDNYLKQFMDEQDLADGEFILDLQKYVIHANTNATYEIAGRKNTVNYPAMGIIFNDHYLTMNHCVNFEKMIGRGVRTVKPQQIKHTTTIGGMTLENVVYDEDNDVAVFKIPEGLSTNIKTYLRNFREPIKQFPLDAKTELKYGERVAIIGNPHLKGPNSRIGRISDLDGIYPGTQGLKKGAYKSSIGMDIKAISGDSGTPVVSMSDKKLLGLVGLTYFGLSYFQPIEKYLKHFKKTVKIK